MGRTFMVVGIIGIVIALFIGKKSSDWRLENEMKFSAREQALVVKDSLIRQDSVLIMNILASHMQSLCDTMTPELKLKLEKLNRFTGEMLLWKQNAEYKISSGKNTRNYKASQTKNKYPYYHQLEVANTIAIKDWLKLDTAQFLKYSVAFLIYENQGDWKEGYQTKVAMEKAKPGTMGIVFQEVDRLNQLEKDAEAKAEIVYQAEIKKNEAWAAGELKKISAVYEAKIKAKKVELGLF